MPRGRPAGTKNRPKSVNLTGEAAAKFGEAREKFNATDNYPFPLTNAQFAIVLCEDFISKNR